MIKYFFIIVITLAFIQVAFAQQPSVIWDEATKSWISGPATAPAPAQTNPTAQTQIPQTTTPQIIQTVPTTPANSSVDLGTLMTIVGPMFAALSGYIIKKQKDGEKEREKIKEEAKQNDEEIRKQAIAEIKAAILPSLNHIVPVADQTAKQAEQINEISALLFDLMGTEKANQIHDKPAIKRDNLIKDSVKSKIIAEQAKNGTNGSIVWDDIKKEWVSK